MSKHATNLRKASARARRNTPQGVGCVIPPRKNVAKSAFAAQKSRTNTATYVASTGNVVSVPWKVSAGI